MVSPPSGRPALLAHQPEQLTAALRPLQIVPRALAFQPAYRRPVAGRWGIVPQAPSPLLVDLCAQSIIDTAMLLADLRHQQRGEPLLPIFIVPRAGIALQRLLVASHLSGLVIPTEASPALLARWLSPALQLGPGLSWVELPPPDPPSSSPHLVPLLPALVPAETVSQAASWCALSGRRAYEVLADSARRLRLPASPWRLPHQWVAALSRALARNPASPKLLAGRTPDAQKESIPMIRNFDVVAANLCGCTIEHLHTQGQQIILDLDEPRQGRITLICEGATLLNPLMEYADLAQRAVWARKIDWVDILDGDTLYICLANGANLALHMRAAHFEQAAGV